MMTSITRAWLGLLALSASSTIVSLSDHALETQCLGGVIILLLAWAKARIIAARYLDLAQSPGYLRGFSLVLGLFMLALLVLYTMGAPAPSGL